MTHGKQCDPGKKSREENCLLEFLFSQTAKPGSHAFSDRDEGASRKKRNKDGTRELEHGTWNMEHEDWGEGGGTNTVYQYDEFQYC